MNSIERTEALAKLGRAVSKELIALNPHRPWTFVEPTETTYTVSLCDAGKGRIHLQFDGYNEPTRINVSGNLNIGKNRQYVQVYTQSTKEHVTSITCALSRGPAAIAKDIAKRFLPEYLRILELAVAKVQADTDYEASIAKNLQRLADVAGVNFHSGDNLNYRGETHTQFTFKVGNDRYYGVTASAKGCSMKLSTLSIAQAEHIIKYLKGGK